MGAKWVEVKKAAKQSIMHGESHTHTHTTKNYLVQNVYSTEVESPNITGRSWVTKS